MGYRIEQAGYEHRGYKLGEEVNLIGRDSTGIIVLFDLNDDTQFVVIKFEGSSYPNIPLPISTTNYRIILDGQLNCENWEWFTETEIEKIITTDEENPPKQISPIHVADILEDTLQMKWYDEADEIRETINECIKSLRA